MSKYKERKLFLAMIYYSSLVKTILDTLTIIQEWEENLSNRDLKIM